MILAVRTALIVLLLLAGWRVVCQVAALGIAEVYPTVEGFQEAIRWDPTGPEYYYRLGLIYRDSPEHQHLQLARYYLGKATDLNPYSWWYWLELARSYEIGATENTEQERKSAEAAYLKAVEINPREAGYRWRFANFYLREGDLEKGLPHFGKAIELEPGSYLQQTLALLWKAGAGSDDILGIWPEDKQARLVLLRFLVGQGAVEQGLLDKQWEKLFQTSDMPSVVEGEFYVRYLLGQKQFGEAKQEWVRLNGRDGFRDLIWNGDFRLPVTGGIFGWKLIVPRKTRKDANGVLEIAFDGTENVDFNGLQQLVVVEPGEGYQFSFRARSEEISTEQGLYFEVVAGSVLLQTEMILGSTSWTEYSGRFKVSRDENLVSVRLRRRPSKRIDNKLRGTLWVDWVRLRKVS